MTGTITYVVTTTDRSLYYATSRADGAAAVAHAWADRAPTLTVIVDRDDDLPLTTAEVFASSSVRATVRALAAQAREMRAA